MEEIKYKTVEAEISKKEAGEGRLQVTFYASIFGNIDSYGDIVEQGAFATTIKEDGHRTRFCYAHAMEEVIGRIDTMQEDDRGLLVTATLAKEGKGKEVTELIQMDAVNEFSIGYRTVKYEREETDDGVITRLTEIKLFEISLVPRAANDQAVILSHEMKSAKDFTVKSLTNDELLALKSDVLAEIDNRIINNILN